LSFSFENGKGEFVFPDFEEVFCMKCGKRIGVGIVLFVGVLFFGLVAEAAPKFMTFAAPPASSNYYPYWVAVAKVVQTANPDFRVNVSESQGAVDIIKKIRSGIVPVGNAQSTSDYESYYGKALFEGSPYQEARILWYFDESPIQFIVSKESGVKSMKDLEGKKFNPGGTGTAVAVTAHQILDTLDVKPDYFEAGQASAADAVSNRQIVGTVKTGNILGPDSYALQIQANVPIDLVSLTEEELEAVTKAYPYLIPHVMPAGIYEGVDHDTNCLKIAMGGTATSKLSQEDGYKIFSAIISPEGRKTLDAAFPNGAKQDIIALTLRSTVPLHAGTVQYLKEHNVEVPSQLIPPEYKD
jgi:TRAP transporter TAXI family solute receptor